MSNGTMTVVAPATAFDTSVDFYGAARAISGGVPAGATFYQAIIPAFASPQFALNSAKFISDYLNKNDLKSAKTLKNFAANVGSFCNADRLIIGNRKITIYDAMMSPSKSKYDYVNMQIKRLSGDVTTPITAWAHFLWGNGAERMVNLVDVGLKIQPNQIDPVMALVNSGVVGTFNVNNKFNRNTMLDGIVPAAYLGNITLHTEGTLSISTSGAWDYKGVVRAYNDVYDANPSTYRGPIGEYSTAVLRHFSGKPYQISIPGQLNVNGGGMRGVKGK